MAEATLDHVEPQLNEIINSLYMLIMQAHGYHGTDTSEAMADEIKRLLRSLTSLAQSARHFPDRLPPEVIDYVERSRNPDIYTREFVELAQRLNQKLKGRSQAYADFRDILAAEMASAIPDTADDVKKVVASTRGMS